MSELPRYQQLKHLIVGRISSGELRPRDRVPSENDLVAATGVSRMTANRALRELHDEGYVDRVAGVGTFVADLKATSHVLEVRNIADEIESRGHRHTATVLRQESVVADDAVVTALGLNPGSRVYCVLLVHEEDGTAIQREERYISAAFAPDCLDQDFTAATPSAYLSGISPLQEAEQVVRAIIPSDAVQRDLNMEPGDPCLLVIRRTWAHGAPVSVARLCHPGSRYELTGHYSPPGTAAKRPEHIELGNLMS